LRVTVVGLGYVGPVTGACLAEWDHDVVGVDADPKRLGALREGRIPFHEPRLPEVAAAGVAGGGVSPSHEPALRECVADGVSAGKLRFSDDLKGASATAEMVVVAVGTHDGNGGWQSAQRG